MIVKIQLSIASSHKKRQVLVYNEDMSVHYEANATPEILELMDSDAKAFFHAKMVGTEISIDARAEWQEW